MVTIKSVKQGITRYFEEECAKKATGLGQFVAYFMAPSIPKLINEKLDQIKSMGVLEDVIKGDSIDLDAVAIRARTAMEKCGSIELMGFRLNVADVDKIVEYIRNEQC